MSRVGATGSAVADGDGEQKGQLVVELFALRV
jgi:hypothetical protein